MKDEPEPAVTVVPIVTPVPEMIIPMMRVPEIVAETVSVVPETVPVTIGAAVATSAALATVCDILTVQVHGKVLKTEQEPNVIKELAASALVPLPSEMVIPMMSVPDATAVTVNVVPEIKPVTDAEGKVGDDASPAGQKKPTGHVFVVPAACPETQK